MPENNYAFNSDNSSTAGDGATMTLFFCGTGESPSQTDNIVPNLFRKMPGVNRRWHGHDKACDFDYKEQVNHDMSAILVGVGGGDGDFATPEANSGAFMKIRGALHGQGTDSNISLALQLIYSRNMMGKGYQIRRINAVGWSRGSWAATQRLPRVIREISEGNVEVISACFGVKSENKELIQKIQNAFSNIEFNAVAIDTVRGPTNHDTRYRTGVLDDAKVPDFCNDFLHLVALDEVSRFFEAEIPHFGPDTKHYQVGLPGHHATLVGNAGTRMKPTTEGPGQAVGLIARRIVSDFLKAHGTTLVDEELLLGEKAALERQLKLYGEIDAHMDEIRELSLASSGVYTKKLAVGPAKDQRRMARYSYDTETHTSSWDDYRGTGELPAEIRATFGTMAASDVTDTADKAFGVSHRLWTSLKYAHLVVAGEYALPDSSNPDQFKVDAKKLYLAFLENTIREIESNDDPRVKKLHDRCVETHQKYLDKETPLELLELERELSHVFLTREFVESLEVHKNIQIRFEDFAVDLEDSKRRNAVLLAYTNGMNHYEALHTLECDRYMDSPERGMALNTFANHEILANRLLDHFVKPCVKLQSQIESLKDLDSKYFDKEITEMMYERLNKTLFNLDLTLATVPKDQMTLERMEATIGPELIKKIENLSADMGIMLGLQESLAQLPQTPENEKQRDRLLAELDTYKVIVYSNSSVLNNSLNERKVEVLAELKKAKRSSASDSKKTSPDSSYAASSRDPSDKSPTTTPRTSKHEQDSGVDPASDSEDNADQAKRNTGLGSNTH